jgi:glutathione S-transferase
MELEIVEFAPVKDPLILSYSPYCLRLNWVLIWSGLDYRRRHVTHPGAVKKLNPRGQLPILMIDGTPYADSLVAIEELHARGLLPWADGVDAMSGAARNWVRFADHVLNPYLLAARWVDPRNWDAVYAAFFGGIPSLVRPIVAGKLRKGVTKGLVHRDTIRGGLNATWERFSELLDDLEAEAPATGFWCAADPTIADFAMGATLTSLGCSLTPWQAGELAKRATLSAYVARVQALVAT